MITHRVSRDEVAWRERARDGWVLAREIEPTAGHPGFPKGHVLAAADIGRLMDLSWQELHVVEPEPGELYETQAGLRIATAVAGDGATVGALGGGHWPIVSTRRGLVRIAVDALDRMNRIEGICAYTRYDAQIVDSGSIVARAKVTPLLLADRQVVRAEQLAREAGGLVRVAGFRPSTIAAVVQETLDPRAAARFTAALTAKVTWFGSRLLAPRFVAATEPAIADAMRGAADDGADVILMAGTKSLDPLDPAFMALNRLGIRLDRFGVPAHPGSLFWLAHWDRTPVVGLPTCGLFAQLTSFDLIFPRILAGDPVDAAALARLGHGGLLAHDVSFFPPYSAPAD